MKNIAILGGIAIMIGVIGWGYLMTPSTMEVERFAEPEVIVKTEIKDSLEERIKEAQDEARSSVEAKAQAAYEAVLQDEMNAIADSVKTDYIAEIEATITSEHY